MNRSMTVDDTDQQALGKAAKLPDFLLIGAAKSGTTSLIDYLGQHPDVFIPSVKEPNYFALADREDLPPPGPVPANVLFEILYRKTTVNFDAYRALFDGAQPRQTIGEGSVRYLYFPEAANRIQATLPDARLVAVLRHPVDRVISHYSMNRQFQLEPLNLQAALDQEEDRKRAGWGWDWHYAGVSRYSGQLARYYERFDREQIRVFLFDDLLSEPNRVFQEICQHIGVDAQFSPDMSKRSKTGYQPLSKTLDRWLYWPNRFREKCKRSCPGFSHAIISRLKRWNRCRTPAPPSDATRAHLHDLFRDELRSLQDVLNRKLPWVH